MSITSIDIDDELLNEVKRITGSRTKKEAVTAALQRTVMMQRQRDALEAIADPEFQEILSHMHESADGSPPES
ncbi:type II toxin-antitoxin system VapB family antitoxin [Paramicrobacterium chengjingii]|uniref:Type II toxin-antitoxin system VapB family antitoxin n=1 Tax=Paramicrobacterium chengjingii TaxID=2769067 RepID=A0ABX6YHS5_9MICO|nr:type II toxin-antitoxin system VapB family antitoxin [Microbacterium chengjingii]QPZ38347.1 type II toxin-antitoxin system VapB family antitoxin [Microbacterium chengjingii]